jgi:hypothetical protein
MNEPSRLRFGIRDLLWATVVVALAVGWYSDRMANHYAYNARQFTRLLDAKQQAERTLASCREELEEYRARAKPDHAAR